MMTVDEIIDFTEETMEKLVDELVNSINNNDVIERDLLLKLQACKEAGIRMTEFFDMLSDLILNPQIHIKSSCRGDLCKPEHCDIYQQCDDAGFAEWLLDDQPLVPEDF